ncbi:MAG: fibronectin type III domain-containing protein [Acidobacteriaceae bacterium]
MRRNETTGPKPFRVTFLPGCVLLAGLVAGCGTPGVPKPPSLKLPETVKDLKAERAGNAVLLHWTMPRETTDGMPLQGPQTVEICRSVGAHAEKAKCDKVAALKADPGKTVDTQDTLPDALASGAPRLLAYRVQVLNANGRSAGESAAAYVAGGGAPARVTYFSAETTRQGVMLHWHREASSKGTTELLVTRELLEKPQAAALAKSDAMLGSMSPEPEQQLLRIAAPAGEDPGQALDLNARFGRTYRYTIQRVEHITVGNQQVELRSPASNVVMLAVRDTFPPAIPAGLDVVLVPPAAGSSSYSVDMSWTPNTEPDLAGYIVYRRDETSNAAAVPLNSKSALAVAPTFHDTGIQPGHRYAYTVSAVDQAGNESQPSAPTELSVPAAP